MRRAARQRDLDGGWMVGPSITGSQYGRPTSTTSTPASTIATIASIAAVDGREAGRQVADERGPALGPGGGEDVVERLGVTCPRPTRPAAAARRRRVGRLDELLVADDPN